MKRKIGLAIAVYVALLIGIYLINPEGVRQMFGRTNNEDPVRVELDDRTRELIRKANYGAFMYFEFSIFFEGERIYSAGAFAVRLLDPHLANFSFPGYDPIVNDVVFVHSEAESRGFPDNVIVAWPRDDEALNNRRIEQIHRNVNMSESELMRGGRLHRPVVTLEEFGLTYPVTVADLVDNWEKVDALREVMRLNH